MPQLNFKEIPQANIPSGEQDTFELFARDFLELFGFKALSGPDRGADLGRDLIVQETRTGVAGETIVRWLVSCKHKAHSGQSVGLSDESDILDRVQIHNCSGFIGCYSTIPASSLTQKLEALKTNTPSFDFQIFDREKIESIILSTGPGQGIAQRYFPSSYAKWGEQNLNIDLAMARIGMPQPVTYRLPNDDKILTLEEVMKLYPQGNRYIFNPWLPGNLILSNNLLGITKLLDRDKGPIDPPVDYFQRMNESMILNIEAMRQHRLEDNLRKQTDDAAKGSNRSSLGKRKSSKQRMAKESRKRNRR
jgi:hypothetical protein